MHMLFSETRSLVLSCYASKQSETSTFKWDKLGTATNADYRIIASGNTWAHAGDAVVDAGLYKGGGGRWDVFTYERLYGMDSLRVAAIRILTCAISQFTRLTLADHEPTIAGLHTHTCIIPSKYKQGTPLFYAAFDKFIRPLKESEYDDVSYLSNHTSDLARAYFQFRCVAGEIHDAQPVFLSGPARLACMKPGLQIEAAPLGSSVQPAE